MRRHTITATGSSRDNDESSRVREFERFYRSNVTTVYSFAAQRVGSHEAEDVTAEVFQAAALVFRNGDGNNLTTGWLISVCRNKVIDRWRAASRRQAKVHLIRQRYARPPERAVDDQLDLRNAAVLMALDQLSKRHRSLLVLHHIDGMPISEIAAAAGLSPSAIESALARARRAFRRNYAESEGRNAT